MPTVAELDIQIDATNNAMDELRAVNAEIDRLSGRDATARVDADTSDADRDISRLIAQLERLAARDVDIQVDALTQRAERKLARLEQEARDLTAQINVDADLTAARVRLRSLEAAIQAIEGHVNIDADTTAANATVQLLRARIAAMRAEMRVDVDTSSGIRNLGQLSIAAERAGTNIRGIWAAALLLWPAAIPLLAATSAGLMGIGTLAVAAGVGVGLFGAVAVSAMGPVADALKKIETHQRAANVAITDKAKEQALKRVQAELNALEPAQRRVVEEVLRFRDAWGQFVDRFEPQVFQLAADGLGLLTTLLPQAVPIVDSVAQAFDRLLDRATVAMTGPQWTAFTDFLGRQAGPAIETLIVALSNLGLGFGGMLMAFEPFQQGFNQGFIEMTARFREWGMALGQSEGFRDFIAYMREAIPQAIQFLKSLWSALFEIVQAVAPYGTVVLGGLRLVLDAITALGEQSPAMLALGIALIGVGTAALSLLGPLTSILRLFSVAGASVAFLASKVGLAAGTFLLIVAAVAAAVAAFVYAYTQIEGFRVFIGEAWNSIKAGAQAFSSWFMATFGPAIAAVVAFVSAEWQKMVAWAREIEPQLRVLWGQVVDGVRNFGVTISAIWNAIWPLLSSGVQAAWVTIKAVVSGGLEVIRGLITMALGLLNMDWSTFWNGLTMVVSGVWTAIIGVIQGAFSALLGVFLVWGADMRASWEASWNTIRDIPQTIMTAIGAIISTGLDMIVQTVANWVGNVIAWFQNLYMTLVGGSIVPDMINAIIQWFAQLPAQVLAILAGFVTSVVSAFVNMAAEVISTVVSFLASLVAAFVSGFAEVVSTVVTALAEVLSSVVSTMAEVLSTIVSTIAEVVSNVASGFADVVSTVINAMAEVLSTIVSTFAQIVSTVASSIATVVANFVSGFAQVLATVVSAMAQVLSTVVSTFAQIVSTVASSIATVVANFISGFAQVVATVINAMAQALVAVVRAFAQIVSTVVSSMAQVVSNVASGFANVVSAAASGMASMVSAIVGGMRNALGAVVSGISAMVSAAFGAVGRFASAGAAMIGGFVSGIRSRMGDAIAAVRSGISTIAGLLPGSPAKWGPLSGQGYTYLRGQAFTGDLARGIEQQKSEVIRQARDLADIMTLNYGPPGMAFDRIARGMTAPVGGGGTTINLQNGAVTLELVLGTGVDPQQARQAFDGAGEDLATKIATAIQRR